MDKADVVLVCPPIAPAKSPSFGLSLLKAALTKENISCYIDYASIYFLNKIGADMFKIDWMNMDSFFVEYIFALAAGIRVPYDFEEVFRMHMGNVNPYRLKMLGYEEINEEVLRIHKEAALRCIEIAKTETERTVERILAMEPKVVGCSVITLQLNAGLAILKRIKELRPDITTIIGGYHCFGESGVAVIKEFPYIDYVFSGESDDLIAPFCSSILMGEEPKLEYGILKQGGPYPAVPPHRVLMNMNLAPIPDYSDFLELLATEEGQKFVAAYAQKASIKEFFLFLFESSRGCWWGAKSACTFCGLNGALKNHRRKNPEVFLDQLEQFVKLYDNEHVVLTDTLIPMDYMETVVPRLAEKPLATMDSEIKAIMSEADIELLRKAGYNSLMIGVESLSDHVLQLMHKGTLAINNLASIKFCMKHDVIPGWNLLTNFPGEEAEDYQEQLAILPLIEHFKPPAFIGPICYIRNSEYVNNPDKYGIKLRPSKGMYCISPANEKYVQATATVYELVEPLKETEELKKTRALCIEKYMQWMNKVVYQGSPYLDMRRYKDYVKLIDTRACRTAAVHKLYGVDQEVYLYCEKPRLEQLLLKAPELAKYSEQELKAALDKLLENKLLIKIKNTYLALGIEISAKDYVLRYIMGK